VQSWLRLLRSQLLLRAVLRLLVELRL